ncbi:MAG: CinA family nicotinamide mononucleotide deamidase-related protein [Planctomycetota bacterium]
MPRFLKGEILAIGDELIQGWNVDTNSSEIARELLIHGVRIVRIAAVGDECVEIKNAFDSSCKRADVVIVTGGLGPTDDDLTREGAAAALGVELEFVQECWKAIENRLRGRYINIPESNRRQAFRPAGTSTIINNNGTAPGFQFHLANAEVFCLPGVPREMRPMLHDSVIPEIQRLHPEVSKYYRKTVKCFGAPEATIGEMIQKWMAARDADPLVGITVSNAVHTISILSADETVANDTASAIAQALGPLVFSTENETLEAAVAKLLISRKLTIALAESCTGGLASSLLTNVPGISKALMESFVTYSNDAKIARLGVDEKLIKQFGAVSKECAAAMAEGVRRAANTQIGVAITGIAGPSGGTPEKPAGLVYFSVSLNGNITTHEKNYTKLERNFLRDVAAREALNLVRLAVQSE